MNSMFHDFIDKFMQVYIDDIVIKSNSENGHLDHLRQSFERMRKYGLKMNPLKCAFGVHATAKINRVATNIFILKRKGMPANHKTKQRSHDQRKRVRESVTRGEGISTPRAHRTRWYPRLCLNLWVCKQIYANLD